MVESAVERVAAASRAVEAPGPIGWYAAPGHVNLMGDHTDQEEGFVLPAAIDRACVVAARPLDGRVRVRSMDVPAEVDLPPDGTEEPTGVEPGWGRSVAGVIRALSDAGRRPVGADLVLASDVPLGAGLSLSAALEVAVAPALCEVAGFEMERSALAQACQRAEHMATGVPCGVMDQMVSLAGVEGSALLIDCRSLVTRPVPIPDDLAILVVHSGGCSRRARPASAKTPGSRPQNLTHWPRRWWTPAVWAPG
jgi:galactokinase